MKLPSGLGSYHWVHRRYPEVSRKAIKWLMAVELVGLIPVLVLFGISQPDLYRSEMWRIGWDHRLNSNPAVILYAYANHRPQPNIPLIWSQTLTDFNVAISIISLFFLLVKLITFIMKVWYPIVSTFISISLTALYAVSVYGQIGPDYLDERYPAPAAWYFRYGCEMARPYGSYTSCQVAQSSLFLALYMLIVYLLNLGFSLYAMWPNKDNDLMEDEDDEFAPSKSEPDLVELEGMSGAMPFTPRTHAFHTLNRDLPLRSTQDRFA